MSPGTINARKKNYEKKNIRVKIPETVIHLSWSVVSLAFWDICTKHPLSSFSCLMYAPAFPMIIPAVELGIRIFTFKFIVVHYYCERNLQLIGTGTTYACRSRVIG